MNKTLFLCPTGFMIQQEGRSPPGLILQRVAAVGLYFVGKCDY